MASVIAVVRLAPGRVGYFDDITRIHLTIASPEKPVIEGMNVSNLKRAVRGGSIKVVSGSLEPEATLKQETVIESQIPVAPIITEPAEVITAQISRVVEVPVVSEPAQVEESVKVEEPAEVIEPVKEEAPIVEEAPVAEEIVVAPVEEIVAPAVEEVVVAAPKAKSKKKK